MSYTPQVADLLFTLDHICGFGALIERGLAGELDRDIVGSILEEAGRFAEERLAPLNSLGDREGARLENGVVHVPAGWNDAYREWVAGGWAGLAGPEEFGGQDLPISVQMAVQEIWNSANLAFGLNPLLTQGAVEALAAFADEHLKATYLPKMVSGEWSGTMDLTEPHAGSDLRFLKTRAEPQPDGSYKITGTKIFITYGDHEMTENIIHLVLARLPGAPEGTKGISLFLVPKFLPSADGAPGSRNDFACAKLEHKLGIHASPTCVMNFGDHGGATGYLVGEPNRGLTAMFTMMNRARLAVGVQGVALAERAFQQARSYARERLQGPDVRASDGRMVTIIHHPDVRRMLLDMAAKTAAARAICLLTATALDRSFRAPDDAERTTASAEAALLTPIAKAFSTDIAVTAASEGVQVHGGMGYIEETGAAQYLRDARILPIYEGTNGIQAIDLVTRKLPLEGGQTVRRVLVSLREIAEQVQAANEPALGDLGARLQEGLGALEKASLWMGQTLATDPQRALAGAVPYARAFGLGLGGALLARGALARLRAGAGEDGPAPGDPILIARHFAENLLPETVALSKVIERAHDTVLDDTPLLAPDQ